jgi:hypothetical protein
MSECWRGARDRPATVQQPPEKPPNQALAGVFVAPDAMKYVASSRGGDHGGARRAGGTEFFCQAPFIKHCDSDQANLPCEIKGMMLK